MPLFALDDAASISELAARRAPGGELVLLISRGEALEQRAWAVNMLSNLHELRLANYVVLRDDRAACASLLRMAAAFSGDLGGEVGCAWCKPSRLRALHLRPGERRALNDLWLLRWWLASEQ